MMILLQESQVSLDTKDFSLYVKVVIIVHFYLQKMKPTYTILFDIQVFISAISFCAAARYLLQVVTESST